MLKIIEKLLYREDDPKNLGFANRRWRWWPFISIVKWSIDIGISYQLVQYDGKVETPQWLHGIYLGFSPFSWSFGQHHTYYEGPHCRYEFGPFFFIKELYKCKKCDADNC